MPQQQRPPRQRLCSNGVCGNYTWAFRLKPVNFQKRHITGLCCVEWHITTLESVDDPVTKLLAAQTEGEAHAAFENFEMTPASNVRPLLAGLSHPNRAVRYHAVYLLGSRWKDKRVVPPLLDVLRNRDEDEDVRSTIADQLGHHRRQRMILPTLIEVSRDPNPVVRFWCVFALGSQLKYRRRPPLAAVRALESLLDDGAAVPGWWQVRLEAIAMLDGVTKSRKRTLFRETIRQVFDKPLDHPEKWKWAVNYVCDNLNELEIAARRLSETGVDPVTFGDGIKGSWMLWPRPTPADEPNPPLCS
jgi:hypothetical protein